MALSLICHNNLVPNGQQKCVTHNEQGLIRIYFVYFGRSFYLSHRQKIKSRYMDKWTKNPLSLKLQVVQNYQFLSNRVFWTDY